MNPVWVRWNPNPRREEEPDCVIRAICAATGMSWHEVFRDLCNLADYECTMPSANWLWGVYLRRLGFRPFLLPESCPECITVSAFCERFPEGVYIIGTGSHAVACISGNYYDSWDSGSETPTYFWKG